MEYSCQAPFYSYQSYYYDINIFPIDPEDIGRFFILGKSHFKKHYVLSMIEKTNIDSLKLKKVLFYKQHLYKNGRHGFSFLPEKEIIRPISHYSWFIPSVYVESSAPLYLYELNVS